MGDVVATVSEPSHGIPPGHGIERLAGRFHEGFAGAGSETAQDTLDLREGFPTFYIGCPGAYPGWDTQGGRGWLEKASPSEMAVEELPLGPLEEIPTAYRDRRRAFAM
jgi:hypothetical protein